MVPKPAHSGCESWLQSVWAVGRHLSQYPSAVDALAAPGTCKQLTPQITAHGLWRVHGTETAVGARARARAGADCRLQSSFSPANSTNVGIKHSTRRVFERTATMAHRYSFKERTRRSNALNLCTAPQPKFSWTFAQ